jgi:hypothetical protein
VHSAYWDSAICIFGQILKNIILGPIFFGLFSFGHLRFGLSRSHRLLILVGFRQVWRLFFLSWFIVEKKFLATNWKMNICKANFRLVKIVIIQKSKWLTKYCHFDFCIITIFEKKSLSVRKCQNLGFY